MWFAMNETHVITRPRRLNSTYEHSMLNLWQIHECDDEKCFLHVSIRVI